MSYRGNKTINCQNKVSNKDNNLMKRINNAKDVAYRIAIGHYSIMKRDNISVI